MYTLEVNYVDLFGQPYYYPPVQQIAKVPKHLTVIIDKSDPSHIICTNQYVPPTSMMFCLVQGSQDGPALRRIWELHVVACTSSS